MCFLGIINLLVGFCYLFGCVFTLFVIERIKNSDLRVKYTYNCVLQRSNNCYSKDKVVLSKNQISDPN